MYEERIAHLEEAHRALDEKIKVLEAQGGYDSLHIAELKKKKLFLKDVIAELKTKNAEE